jgi:hypothetical protein
MLNWDRQYQARIDKAGAGKAGSIMIGVMK